MLLLFESLFIKFILSSAFPVKCRQPFLPFYLFIFTFKKIFHFSFFTFPFNRRQPFFTFLPFYFFTFKIPSTASR